MAASSDVHLNANTVARRVSAMATNLTGQVNRDLTAFKLFSIRCDESVPLMVSRNVKDHNKSY